MEIKGWNELQEYIKAKNKAKEKKDESEPFWRKDKTRLCSSGARLGMSEYC